jgi:hypothetical protein
MVNADLSAAVKLIMLCLMTASLSHFYQFTKEPGEIFGRWGLLLTFFWIKNWRRKDRWKRTLLKPLICLYCGGTWLFIILYTINIPLYVSFIPMFLPKIIGLFLGCGINYFFMELIARVIHK